VQAALQLSMLWLADGESDAISRRVARVPARCLVLRANLMGIRPDQRDPNDHVASHVGAALIPRVEGQAQLGAGQVALCQSFCFPVTELLSDKDSATDLAAAKTTQMARTVATMVWM